MTSTLSATQVLFDRHMRHLVRMPEKLLSVTLMPVAYVILFGVLFGSAMRAPSANYHEYLMAGILAQTMLTNMSSTALGVADDLRSGLIDRFRSMPMSVLPVLTARTASNVVLSAVSILLMGVVGAFLGWRMNGPLPDSLAAIGLLLLLGWTMSWVGAVLGLLVRDGEAISSIAVVFILPLTFLSNAFIPLDGLPGWLRTVCEWNPLSAVVTACRHLFRNPTGPLGEAWPQQNPLIAAVVLLTVVLAVAVPVAMRLYRTAVAR